MYSNVLNVFNKLVRCASAIALCESSSGGFGKRQGRIKHSKLHASEESIFCRPLLTS